MARLGVDPPPDNVQSNLTQFLSGIKWRRATRTKLLLWLPLLPPVLVLLPLLVPLLSLLALPIVVPVLPLVAAARS